MSMLRPQSAQLVFRPCVTDYIAIDDAIVAAAQLQRLLQTLIHTSIDLLMLPHSDK
jgi:hypothetical protein